MTKPEESLDIKEDAQASATEPSGCTKVLLAEAWAELLA